MRAFSHIFLVTLLTCFGANCSILESPCKPGDLGCDTLSLLAFQSLRRCNYQTWTALGSYQYDNTDTQLEFVDHKYVGNMLYGLMWRENAGSNNASVATSTDNGLTWNTNTFYQNSGNSTKPMDFVILGDGSILMAVDASPAGVQTWLIERSTDGGTSWTTRDSFNYVGGQNSIALKLIAVDDSTIYAFGNGNDATHDRVVVRRSLDGGLTWNTVYQYIASPAANTYFKSIEYSGGVFYMTALEETSKNVIYFRSLDGSNWSPIASVNTACCAIGADKHGPRTSLVYGNQLYTGNWTGASLLDWSVEAIDLDGSNPFQSDFVTHNPNVSVPINFLLDADNTPLLLGATGPGNPDTVVIRKLQGGVWSEEFRTSAVTSNSNVFTMAFYMDPSLNLYYNLQDNQANPFVHVFGSSCN